MFVWKDTDRAPTKIAVHLPTTGDQFYYFRKQIALDLLKHDIASVIPMLPYYGPRKPPSSTRTSSRRWRRWSRRRAPA